MPPSDDDIVLAFPKAIRPVRHVRSTLLMASIESVRRHGRFEDYERALAREHKAALFESVAGTWLPLEVAVAHYTACDALGVPPEQQANAGRSTFEGARPTLLGTAVRLAKTAGFSPWQAFPLFQRFWERGLDGGGVQITREGPKDALITVVQVPLTSSAYFRNGLRGLASALTGLFCQRAYATERAHGGAGTLVLRVQWA